MIRLLVALLLCLTALAAPRAAHAHALEPGYAEMQDMGGNTWQVFWRQPDVAGRPMAIALQLPVSCTGAAPPAPEFDGRAWSSRWVVNCPAGLTGQVIAVPGLDAQTTDVLLRIAPQGEAAIIARLTPELLSFAVPARQTTFEVMRSYFALGVEHILGGIDHLLFVFALLVLVPDLRRLIGAVTAFTVAHSITLAAASLGVLNIPGPPVEAVIALSIVFLAVEIIKREEGVPRLSERRPWLISFPFGLLHGLGFAGALAEIGLPPGDIPAALLSFNLGVEAGQLAFILAVLALAALIGRILSTDLRHIQRPGHVGALVMGYGIGNVATVWLAQRIAAF